MDLLQIYQFLFTDSLITHMVLPVHKEFVFIAMKAFGNYDMLIPAFISSFAGLCAVMFNYYLGYFIRLFSKYDYSDQKKDFLTNIVKYSRKYGYFGLILLMVPILGSVYGLLLGFSGSSIKKIIPTSIIIFLIYYLI